MNWLNSFIDGFEKFATMHPFILLMIVGAYVAAVGQLNAPTKDSPTWYRMTFAVLNFFSLQFGRMFPKVENSPNFLSAVAKSVAQNGGTTTNIPGPVSVPNPPGGAK